MTILMTYHKLVERDSQHVNHYWKVSVILILLLSIVCCIVGSLSLQKIVDNYDNRCILDAKLKFEEKPNKFISLARNAEDNNSSPGIRFFKKFLTDSYENISPENKNQMYSTKQISIMDNHQILELNTDWGKDSSCDFAIFIPIFQCCFGIIFLVMFLICDRGGQSSVENHSFLPKPWRIVTPSLLFFLSMTIVSIVNLTNISKGLATFCKSFEENTDEVSCIIAMNHFRLKHDVLIRPAIFYILTIIFSWILLFCWLILTIIMILRIIFVVDFQLIRVTVKTCEFESNDGHNHEVMLTAKEPKNSFSIEDDDIDSDTQLTTINDQQF
ncbi:hypothetical protein PVAND_000750 [Polypedilum vanderplanki]|uniref:Uncharacterized protein n=1 Tax=Polypedilum vanderplanki TaxID=319348 RepID=A0A9J6BL98_POLVA|nr:hypothetical protein PVAND_000750 [Polypedilum vanderplanki]